MLLKPNQGQKGFTLIELAIVVRRSSVSWRPSPFRTSCAIKPSRASRKPKPTGAIFVAETAYLSENSRYSSFAEIGYALAINTKPLHVSQPHCCRWCGSVRRQRVYAYGDCIDQINCGAPASCTLRHRCGPSRTVV